MCILCLQARELYIMQLYTLILYCTMQNFVSLLLYSNKEKCSVIYANCTFLSTVILYTAFLFFFLNSGHFLKVDIFIFPFRYLLLRSSTVTITILKKYWIAFKTNILLSNKTTHFIFYMLFCSLSLIILYLLCFTELHYEIIFLPKPAAFERYIYIFFLNCIYFTDNFS